MIQELFGQTLRCLRACHVLLAAAPQDDDMIELRKEMQRIIDLLDGIFFPGMIGRRAA
jgi:hypothetical protein